MLTHVELGVYGYVGIIMLIGIVKKNAIMMIDFAIAAERAGAHDAGARRSCEAASVRFRPIMMTTVSAIAGTLPIAIGVGASAASRRPLGIAVVGGLAVSQIVTLYVTPVFYTYLDELQTWLGRRSARFAGGGRRPAGAPAIDVADPERMNFTDALHPPAGHDDARHDRRSSSSASSPTSSCR